MSCNRQNLKGKCSLYKNNNLKECIDCKRSLNEQEKSDNKTKLVETSDYITTAYGSLKYYKCEKCGCDEILDYINFCPSCGREITD